MMQEESTRSFANSEPIRIHKLDDGRKVALKGDQEILLAARSASGRR
jgi:hypothetical protein